MTSVAAAPRDNTLYGPADWEKRRYLGTLNHSAVRYWHPKADQWRRERCEFDPMMFALMYLSEHLRSKETDEISLSEFHLAAAEAAKDWVRGDIGIDELRDAWLVAREGGKSTWFFLILTLWALAHGHRKFVIAFSYVSSIAEGHLDTVKKELRDNARLLDDYPGLKVLRRNARQVDLANGATIWVRGLDAASLGAKFGSRRPDLILIDDGEPPGNKYSMHQKAVRLRGLRETLIPLARTAPLILIGTTVKYGSILDDIRRGKEWAAELGFTLHHYPALLRDPDTGEFRSSWPRRWPLDWLLSQRKFADFRLNYQNEPAAPGGTLWKPGDLIYDIGGKVARHIDRRVLALDIAVTDKTTSDYTAIAQVGLAGNIRTCLVERIKIARPDPDALRRLVHSILNLDPSIREVFVETINGGKYIEHALLPLPNGVRLTKVDYQEGDKAHRFSALHVLCQKGQVQFAEEWPDLEEQMYLFPDPGVHDDGIDSVDIAVKQLRRNLPGVT
jgi:predicted phage terminase large subunit-like protein